VKEVRGTIPVTLASKTIRYHGMNITKEIKDLFNENYKSLKKEIKEDIRRWKELPCSIVKTTILPKQSTCSTQSLSKFQ
jgi:hypothetical protein